jgi:hypothetical protein
MRSDQVFVLLLIILIPMTGCFDNSVGDAEGAQDDPTDDNTSPGLPDVTTDSGGSDTDQSSSQERIWYSTGETIPTTWHDGMTYSYSGERCLEYGPLYNSSTGQYIGEECRRYGYPDRASDWDASNCTNLGGTPYWYQLNNYETDETNNTSYAYRWAPSCSDIPLFSLQTNAGEAVLIYQKYGLGTWTTTCNGVTTNLPNYGNNPAAYGLEYYIIPGSSMNCSHELTTSIAFSYDQEIEFDIWSVVYAVQDVTIV